MGTDKRLRGFQPLRRKSKVAISIFSCPGHPRGPPGVIVGEGRCNSRWTSEFSRPVRPPVSKHIYVVTLADHNSPLQTLSIVSVPVAYLPTQDVGNLLAGLGLEGLELQSSSAYEHSSDVLEAFFSAAGRSDLIHETLAGTFFVVEQSPGAFRSLASLTAAAGALALGYTVFGAMAIIAVPTGIVLIVAAPHVGDALGELTERLLGKIAPAS
jgi:hypothetical protein